SIAVAPEHRDIVVTIVGHGQVQLAIAIEVAHDWGDHAHATREARGLLEGPVADPQEHRDVAGKPVARREVLDPITIEVARGHGDRMIETGCNIAPDKRYRLGRGGARAER